MSKPGLKEDRVEKRNRSGREGYFKVRNGYSEMKDRSQESWQSGLIETEKNIVTGYFHWIPAQQSVFCVLFSITTPTAVPSLSMLALRWWRDSALAARWWRGGSVPSILVVLKQQKNSSCCVLRWEYYGFTFPLQHKNNQFILGWHDSPHDRFVFTAAWEGKRFLCWFVATVQRTNSWRTLCWIFCRTKCICIVCVWVIDCVYRWTTLQLPQKWSQIISMSLWSNKKVKVHKYIFLKVVFCHDGTDR